MKKLIGTTILSIFIMSASVYAADCTNECMKACENFSVNKCGDISCQNISDNILNSLKNQLENQFNLPVEFETKTYCTTSAEPSTEQTTIHIETKPQITTETTTKPTTEITTAVTTEATSETTTSVITEATTEATTSTSNNSYAKQVLDLVNNERTKYGLSAVTLNTSLNNVAQVKAEDMKNNNYFSHTSPTYGSPFEMMKSFGISYRTAGENIAKGQNSPQQVVNAWMNSEGHRKNILNSAFTQMGLGFSGQDSKYWVQMFIG